MKKIIGILLIIIGFGYFLLFNSTVKRFLTGLIFNVNLNPVSISLKDSYKPRSPDEKTKAIVRAANIFLNSLNNTQKEKIVYSFSDNKQRANWSNFPEGMVERGGLKLGGLSQKQLGYLDKLIWEIMSEKGMEIINQQMVAENTIPPSCGGEVIPIQLGPGEYGKTLS